MKLFYLLLTVIAVTGCGANNSAETAAGSGPAQLSAKSGDTLIVYGNAGVYYQQDSVTLEKEKQKNTGDFLEGLEEYHVYTDSTNRYLDSAKLTRIDANGSKFIKFVKSNNAATVLKVDTLQGFWGLYFFTPTKEPIEADMTNIRGSYTNYFGK